MGISLLVHEFSPHEQFSWNEMPSQIKRHQCKELGLIAFNKSDQPTQVGNVSHMDPPCQQGNWQLIGYVGMI
jgi:hypothetical protein